MEAEVEAKAIVKQVHILYIENKNKAIERDGFFYPSISGGTGKMKELIDKFEKITGKDWDVAAKDYS